MKLAYTIHEVALKSGRVTPKTVIELDDKAFAELESLGAVRDATEDEIAISGIGAAATTPAAPKMTAAEKKAAKKAEEEAAAKKAEEEAAAKKAEEEAVDPDVTEPDLLGDN